MSYSRRPDDEAPFRRYKRTIEDSEADGILTGMTWDNPWRPGGPYVRCYNEWDHPDWKAYAKHTYALREAWLRGFDTGLVMQKT